MTIPMIPESNLPIKSPSSGANIRFEEGGKSFRAPMPEISSAAAELSGVLTNLKSDADDVLSQFSGELDDLVAEATGEVNSALSGVGYLPPVDFTSGLSVDSSRFTVEYNGNVYGANSSSVPFTTSSTFDPSQWRVLQGVVKSDLTSDEPGKGAKLVQYDETRTVYDVIEEITKPRGSIFISALSLNSSGIGNTAIILSAINDCVASGKELVIDGMFTIREPIVITQLHSGLQTRSSGSDCGFRWADGISFTAGPNDGLIAFRPTGRIENVYICPLMLDGNKAGITASSDNTVHGISILESSLSEYINVVIDSPVAVNNRGSGILCRDGGVLVVSPKSFGNTWHGVGVAFSSSSSGVTRFVDPECFDNGGYGFDASSGSTVVSGSILTYRNGQGGAKTSENCVLFSFDKLIARDNKAFGFRTTGVATNLVLNMGDVDIKGTISDGGGANLGQSISIATGKQVVIKSLITDGASGNSDADIRLGGPAIFSIGSVSCSNAKFRGVYLTGFNGSISDISVVGSGRLGVLVDSASRASVSGLASCVNSNRSGNSGNDQFSFMITGGSSVAVGGGLVMSSTSASSTTTRGVNINGASSLTVMGGMSLSGIGTADAIVSSAAGTTVKVSGASSGIRFESKETITVSGNGSDTAFTLTLTNPVTQLGGGFYTADVYGNSNDANSNAFSVYQVSDSLVRIRYASPPPAGTGNLSYIVRVTSGVYR